MVKTEVLYKLSKLEKAPVPAMSAPSTAQKIVIIPIATESEGDEGNQGAQETPTDEL